MKIVEFIRIYGLLSLLGISLFMCYMFFKAYFSEDYRICIDINSFNEAWWEIIIIPIAIIIGIYAVCYYIKKELKGDR